MATFTDVYKQELKGKGVLSSLGSAALKRTRERLDPRNILFGGSGIIGATGQKIFGKGYQAIQKTAPTGQKLVDSGVVQTQALSSLIESSKSQEAILRIVAKNTSNNNSMARDINVMRQNIMKLVTMGGGKASRGADMFFKDAAARESAFESQFKKERPTTVSPTIVPKKEDASKSITDKILMALGPLGVAISGVISGINSGIEVLKSVFGTLSGLLPSIGTIVSSLQSLASSLGSMLLSPLGVLTAGLAAAGAAIYKLSDTLLKRAEKAGGEKGRELESKMQGEMMQGAMDPLGTSFVTGTNPYTGEKLVTPDDERIKQAQKEQFEKTMAERMSSYRSREGVGRETTPTKVENQISENLVKFIKEKERFSPRAFWDHKQWSIGYGTKSFEGEVIDEKEADRRLRDVLQKSQDAVMSHAKKYNYDFNQNQVDALTSFVYNLGPGILNQLTSSGKRSIEEIAAKIPEYNKASGKVVGGLQKRRAEELAMFTAPAPTTGPTLQSGSTMMAALTRETASQPSNIVVNAPSTTTVASTGRQAPVASATNVDAIELFARIASIGA